jgi:hypothetical protein
MADIGSNVTGLEQGLRGKSAQPVRGEMPRVPERSEPNAGSARAAAVVGVRRHGLWESLTASLDLACRGYLCMQIVDCDPVTDPDCSAAGTKVVVREVPPRGEP